MDIFYDQELGAIVREGPDGARVPLASAELVETLQGQVLAIQSMIAALSFVSDVQYEESSGAFPPAGTEDTLYIDEANSVSYYWDSVSSTYKPSGLPSLNFANSNLTSTGSRTHTFNNSLSIIGTGGKTLTQTSGTNSSTLIFDTFFNGSKLQYTDASVGNPGIAVFLFANKQATMRATATAGGISRKAELIMNGTGGSTSINQITSADRLELHRNYQGIDYRTFGTGYVRFGVNGAFGTARQVWSSGGTAGNCAWITLNVEDIAGAVRTVATLGSAATAGAGAKRYVSDATVTHAAGVGTVAVGGGSNFVPVYSNGSAWVVG